MELVHASAQRACAWRDARIAPGGALVAALEDDDTVRTFEINNQSQTHAEQPAATSAQTQTPASAHPSPDSSSSFSSSSSSSSLSEERQEGEPSSSASLPWTCKRQIPLGDAVRAVDWYPHMRADEPTTCALLAAVRGQPVQLVDGNTGKVRAAYRMYCSDNSDELDDVTAVGFAPDGAVFVAGDATGRIRVVDLSKPGGEAVRHALEAPTRARKRRRGDILDDSERTVARGIVSCLGFAPPHAWCTSRSFLAGTMTGTCGVYDLRVDLQSAPSLRLDGHHGGITSACFGADGDHFAYTSARRDNRILCWDVRGTTQGALFSMERDGAHSNVRLGFQVCPCTGRYVYAGRRDGDVAVFDLQESGHEVARHRIASRGAAVSVVAMCASRPSMLLTAAGARDDGAGAGGRGRLSLWRIVGTT